MKETRESRPQSAWMSGVGSLIFFSRWLQAPLYLGLIIAQLIYVVVFMVELWHLGEHVISHWPAVDESIIMLYVLGLIDVVMIANLLIMVIIGGYETFVSRINLDGHPDQPEWLSHVNANVLKVKLAMAIIGISSIHLLKTFIEVADLGSTNVENITGNTYTQEGVLWQVVIHMVFIVSAIALAWIDRMSLGGKPHGEASVSPASVPAPHSAPPELVAVGAAAPRDREAQAAHYEALARELRAHQQ
ncbi:TIGR00645 family protein [Homoserinimonas hongtaonis]|uniref:UPF0114 protein DF220_04160 n=1 Tax=Homoserinimonas hongtaonis TaxID=2079791 RepID=A0A2U1SZQ9_9MICO|nr:TIGR00645 family protein [Salinibacterium hongtaonis]PWB97120.1 TIGR00645 family protein [Salinibacterium hongtaonis]